MSMCRRISVALVLIAAWLICGAFTSFGSEDVIRKGAGSCVAILRITWKENSLEDIHRAFAELTRSTEFSERVPLEVIFYGTLDDPTYYVHYQRDCSCADEFSATVLGEFARLGDIASFSATVNK